MSQTERFYLKGKKVLLLHTSAGLGHKVIAENMAWHLLKAGAEVKLCDVLTGHKSNAVKILQNTQKYINQHLSFIWSALYWLTSYISVGWKLRVWFAGRRSDHVRSIINSFEPEIVIATQTSAGAILSTLVLDGSFSGLPVIAFSDYHYHPYWVYPPTRHYLVNIPEQAVAVKAELADAKVSVIGITLKPKLDKPLEVNSSHITDDGRPIVLGLSGSQGFGYTADQWKKLILGTLDLDKNIYWVVVCGNNTSLYSELVQMSLPHTTILGYHQHMDELYAQATVVVSKPGGLSVAEMLQFNLKIIVPFILPGQESLNLKYLGQHNLVIDCTTSSPQELVETVVRSFQNPSQEVVPSIARTNLLQTGHEGKTFISSLSAWLGH